jgi:hypothetical protein
MKGVWLSHVTCTRSLTHTSVHNAGNFVPSLLVCLRWGVRIVQVIVALGANLASAAILSST